ncbi:cysteine desulfurase family protein [Actinomyces glycerinitolerans]|uniref:cysteine desulfurase n=1 Tax=Actinomyces glycerinitolerans TaxID=1892869 RepID=A0A1M4RUY7_9ACTO|nr:cysteine desulfurase family protein [Actinomyces glycerinitolerans]SHE23812.1 aminotransferases class-v pyridoxal-phosphate attachment site [Actinomyces glycerinitolerans]
MSSGTAAARVYLDHAATTPVRAEVAAQVAQDLADGLGGWANPAAQHASGRRAGALLAQARSRLAAALNVDPHEVIFTGGGTEADALAVAGRVLAARAAGVERPRVVTSPIEHPAVLDSARTAAAQLGAEHVQLPVDGTGRLEAGALEPALAGGACLVSVMAANNETGLVQDLAGIVAAVRAATGTDRPGTDGYVPVHTDAVAAVGRIPLDFHGWGLDALSLSGHKLGAPVGVGALVARRDFSLVAPTGGGRQERGLRSGTQDVVGARALALAVELTVAERAAEATRLEALRTRLLTGATALAGVHATLPDGAAHLPGTAHLWVEDADAEALLMALDMAGIDVSAGSACHAGVSRPSHVLLAMGYGEEAARATLRCSMGRETRAQDVERLLAALPDAVNTARRTRQRRGALRA